MTASTDRIQAIFQDARGLQADALEMLAQGKDPQCGREILGSDEARHRRPHPGAGPGKSRSGRPRPGQGSGCPGIPGRRRIRERPPASGATMSARPSSARPVFLQRPVRSLGRHRPAWSAETSRTTSTMPSASLKEMPHEKADRPGRRGTGLMAPGAGRGGDAAGTG